MPNVFQNGFSSSRGAAPSEESEPEPFSDEPESYQTGYINGALREALHVYSAKLSKTDDYISGY